MTDYDIAIDVARRAIDATPDDHPNRAIQLDSLAVRLGDRFLRTGAIADLTEAIVLARQAIDAIPNDHPNKAAFLNNLGNRLEDRFSRTGAIADLEEAIGVARQAVDAGPHDHPNRAAFLNSLGIFLRGRFLRTGAIVDLQEAIEVTRQAVDATLADHPDRPAWLNGLGNLLRDRFSRTGAIADLEEAISITRQVIDATPEDHPARAGRLNNLGVCLGVRFSQTGAIVDLEDAIDVTRQAVNATPQDHPNRSSWLNNLGCRIGVRFLRTGATADLEEAISIARQAIDLTPEDQPNRAARLNSLGRWLGARFLRTGTIADLEEAIVVTRQAANATPDDHPNWASLLNNLGAWLGRRFSRTGEMADLDEAIVVARQAVNATPDGHTNYVGLLNNLGSRLGDRFSRTGAIADMQESMECFQRGLESNSSPIAERIRSGRRLLSQPSTLESGGRRLYDLAKTAVNLIPLSAPLLLSASDKRHLLSQAVGIAADAAAIALYVGESPFSAIELLETGRGVLASSLNDLRTDLSALREDEPELAKRFGNLRRQLDAPASRNVTASTESSSGPSFASAADQRHRASRDMSMLLEEIREKPGFNRFLLPLTEEEIRRSAELGPIVIVNVSRHRCDALIIETSGVRSMELRSLSLPAVLERASDVQSIDTLEWLWDVVVSPVLEALGFTKSPPGDVWPHIWWIPTGPLSAFPLHAAGHHQEPGGNTALDRVVSSYGSSVKSIVNTRQQRRQDARVGSSGGVVLVSMSETPGLGSLRHADEEIAAVKAVCVSAGLSPVQPRSHRENTLSALTACQIFHFAGHGGTNSDPLQSRLCLEDWQASPLTVASLLDTNLRSASPFLAYLSACGTGQNLDDDLADESIHLTSAFQLAGFRHVIGTLWEVNDQLCVEMARLTYESLGDMGLDDATVSTALHGATRTLRDRWVQEERHVGPGVRITRDAILCTETATMPLWVPYVHFGV